MDVVGGESFVVFNLSNTMINIAVNLVHVMKTCLGWGSVLDMGYVRSTIEIERYFTSVCNDIDIKYLLY